MSNDGPRMRKTEWVLAAACVLLGAARFAVGEHRPVSPAGSYQALAHLFVGGLFGGWMATGRRSLLWMAAGLSALEVAAFLLSRSG